MDEKKLKRRTSKTRFTRQKWVLENLLLQDESTDQLTSEFNKLEEIFNELQDRHDMYCETIEDTAAYEKKEYIQSCIDELVAVKAKFKSVIQNLPQRQIPLESVPEQSNQTPPSSIRSASPASMTHLTEPEKQLNETPNVHQATLKLRPRVEKVFAGDVREYHNFKDDFQHMVDPQYEARDAVSILRGSLSGKPLYLLVLCTCTMGTQELSQILQNCEDGRFCELAHLVRRCYNILVQVGKGADMNNNNM